MHLMPVGTWSPSLKLSFMLAHCRHGSKHPPAWIHVYSALDLPDALPGLYAQSET